MGRYLICDNPIININGLDKDRLRTAMQLVIEDKAVGWAETNGENGQPVLILYWITRRNDDNYNKFLSPLNRDQMADVAWDWLQSLDKDSAWTHNTINDPDIQIDRGWRIYTEAWGHINNQHQAFIAIEPHSLWIGK